MSDEEFWGILGLSEDVGPRAVFNALSKWRKENKTSPLAPKLHRKWLEVFEKRLLQQLQQLQQQEEIAAKRDTWSSRFFRLLLGGDTLNAAQPRDLVRRPSEMDPQYAETAGLSPRFRSLVEEVQQQQQQQQHGSNSSFLKRYTDPKTSSNTNCSSSSSNTSSSNSNSCSSSRPSTAFQLGLSSLLPLRRVLTGGVIAQWWLASALHRLKAPQQQQQQQQQQLQQQQQQEQEQQQEEGGYEEDMEEQEGTEWLFDDPEFPLSFKED
ncbi:hypothetical protein, conserved [Eimeria acervulina]|uniref:Uncharacterized protein n=1 Tax=Eimeria acervulina TaxID=5801 RepID=U6GLH5_EIMAC|nr:hypothetical protein, conserved [Eimeria acervulina]CDI80138.1 hypothetical protein, conserved [Eimeria acervulina]